MILLPEFVDNLSILKQASGSTIAASTQDDGEEHVKNLVDDEAEERSQSLKQQKLSERNTTKESQVPPSLSVDLRTMAEPQEKKTRLFSTRGKYFQAFGSNNLNVVHLFKDLARFLNRNKSQDKFILFQNILKILIWELFLYFLT